MIYFWLYIWGADWLINLADIHLLTMKDVHEWYYFCCICLYDSELVSNDSSDIISCYFCKAKMSFIFPLWML